MKKIITTIITTFLCLTLVACSNAGDEKIIAGTVTSSSSTSFSINVDGKEYVFDNGDSTIFTSNGLTAGDQIEVTFIGNLKDNDTSDCTVIKVSKLSTANPSDQQISGIVTDASMNSITIDDEGTQYTFALNDNTKITADEGILVGDFVLIAFTGDSISNAVVTSVEVLTDTQVIPQDYEVGQYVGKVMDASMNTVTILAEDNSEITFMIDDQTNINIQGGLSEGTNVIITYVGDIIDYNADDVTVLSIDAK